MRCETKGTGDGLSLLISSQIPGRKVGLRKGKSSVIKIHLADGKVCDSKRLEDSLLLRAVS